MILEGTLCMLRSVTLARTEAIFMYEALTALLPELECEKVGEWIIDEEGEGTMEKPLHMPWVYRGKVMCKVSYEIYRFYREHPEYEIGNYMKVLKQKGLIKKRVVLAKVYEPDVSDLDGEAVIALLTKSERDDRFCDGAFLECFENGSIKRWLTRLKEIDEMSAGA